MLSKVEKNAILNEVEKNCTVPRIVFVQLPIITYILLLTWFCHVSAVSNVTAIQLVSSSKSNSGDLFISWK